MPVIRIADELFQNNYFEAALTRYKALAEDDDFHIEAHEARFKQALTLVQLDREPEARELLKLLSGTQFEPFALAEEGTLEVLGSSADRNPQNGIWLFSNLLHKFPQSQAKTLILKCAKQMQSYHLHLIEPFDMEQNCDLKQQLLQVAQDAYTPPAQSQVSSMAHGVGYQVQMGEWEAVTAI